tara:strand:- start:417 stop:1793 length:1377 start_codon:yes stop_codon:yes gene_type:complete
MLNKKKITYFILWIITILIAIIFTFENPHKIEAIKNKLKTKEKSNNNFEQIKIVDSAFYSLNLDMIKTPVWSKYGGIESIGDKIYYISGDSDFFELQINKNKDDKYIFVPLSINKIDNNKDMFLIKNESTLDKNHAWSYFGIKDILIDEFNSFKNKILLVSSLYYHVDEDCYDMSVFFSEIISENELQITNWKKIFSSEKCLSINLTKKPNFAAASAGGRIVKFDDENILLSIGDFYADGVNGPMLSQDLNNDYGKILKINIKTKKHEIFSFGHRNPQGLYIDNDGNIFSTEHGPRGGDELNLIKQKNNYGWPYASFGTNYNSYNAYTVDTSNDDNKKKRIWPLDKTNNTHNNYTKPIFSWGNTYGVSNLIIYENDYFSKWNKNIIVSSLASKQLTRFVFNYENSSIHYLENIPIGKRIRDIIPLKNGKIALLTDITESNEISIENHAEIILLDNADN